MESIHSLFKSANCSSAYQYLANLIKYPTATKEGAKKSFYFRQNCYKNKNEPRTKLNEENLKIFDDINQENWNQLKQLDNIFEFNEKRLEVIEKFIAKITKLDYQKQPRENYHKDYIVIMGSISAGKSSILNKLLGCKQQVGVGETTLSVNSIYENGKVDVSDSPGISKDYDIFNVEVLKGLLEMDTFIVCYQNCVSQVYEITKILHAISTKWEQKLYLVRTQCDRFSSSDSVTLEQLIQIDKQYVKKRFNLNIEIIATSAKSNMQSYGNQRLQDILKGNNQNQDFQKLKDEV